MLNHILGILIGYAATGCVCVYIDTAVQNAKTAKKNRTNAVCGASRF